MKWPGIWLALFVLFWLFESVVLGYDAATAAGSAVVLALGVTLGSWFGTSRKRRSQA